MSIRIALALGVAVALPSLAQAAALTPPGTQLRTENLVQVVRVHQHMHHMHYHHHHQHRMMSKGPGRCGENMYFSRKAGHCMDARDKA
jgi:hypothetical protein